MAIYLDSQGPSVVMNLFDGYTIDKIIIPPIMSPIEEFFLSIYNIYVAHMVYQGMDDQGNLIYTNTASKTYYALPEELMEFHINPPDVRFYFTSKLREEMLIPYWRIDFRAIKSD